MELNARILRDVFPPCGCIPGEESEGWQEIRSERCEQQEREAFEAAIVGYLAWHGYPI